jgi:hypothetical protein
VSGLRAAAERVLDQCREALRPVKG